MAEKEKTLYILKQALKSKNLKITGSRKSILGMISEIQGVFSPEELFVRCFKIQPGIGIATVYRTIRLLENLELLERSKDYYKKNNYKLRLHLNYSKENEAEEATALDKNNRILDIEREKELFLSLKDVVPGYMDLTYDHMEDLFDETDKIKKEIKLEDLINDVSNVDNVLVKYGNSKNSLIQMLIDFQAKYNWLPKHVLFYISKKLDIPLTQIYSIASFYTFFNLEPKGKYHVVVCAGTACHVRGSTTLIQRIKNILKINPGNTTPDYKFSLDTVNCLGCCALGPVLMFNNKYYSDPSSKQLEKMFNSAE